MGFNNDNDLVKTPTDTRKRSKTNPKRVTDAFDIKEESYIKEEGIGVDYDEEDERRRRKKHRQRREREEI